MSNKLQEAESVLNIHIPEIVKRSNGTETDIARLIWARTRHDHNLKNAVLRWACHQLACNSSQWEGRS